MTDHSNVSASARAEVCPTTPARRNLMDMPRLGMDAESLAKAFQANFTLTLGRDGSCSSLHYHRNALALTLRDRLVERWRDSSVSYAAASCRRLHYLSLEYLIGRSLSNAALNLGVGEAMTDALYQFGLNAEEIAESEADAGLGNGGLGRLAACFLDSCATLQLPVRGYGLRYQYGMFRQQIDNGWQLEEPDRWLREDNPWEFERPEFTRRVRFGGYTWSGRDREGRLRFGWRDTQDVLAVPYDMPVPGYRNGTVNSLRLWSAAPTDEFDLGEFNEGSYTESVRSKNDAENITMVLYPNDTTESGKELRLRQQYFLASATLQDVIADWKNTHGSDFREFASKNCFQLNDTHPTVAVAELMRLLMDEEGLEWDQAWQITTQTMAYTNHTLLPEALERWPVAMFRQLLPRVLEVIFEINARFLAEVSNRWPGDLDRLRRMSIIDENGEQQVRMAHLALVGSFSVNGVAELHSKLLAEQLFRDFYELWPSKFNNKTNGVTQRRWLAHCNPALSGLIGSAIGDGWVREMEQLSALRPFAEDPGFRQEWRAVRQQNKARLAAMVERECGVRFDPSHLFDVQVKRIHEYKRQLLNVLHVIHLYDRVKRGDLSTWAPRCVLFGGKAAPGYQRAKLIVKLIGNVAAVINQDPSLRGLLSVAFLPNYRVSAMEAICPGTDLSEQISTAGKEASGTGNMKFMMNGALTIGTLDGANIEIRDAVGDDHFFLFGLTADEVLATRNSYQPQRYVDADPAFARVMELLRSEHFNRFESKLFQPIIDSIVSPDDPWMVAADFSSYIAAQAHADERFRDIDSWSRSSILNTAASGWFSTDRTIREYNDDIWNLTPVAPQPNLARHANIASEGRPHRHFD